MQYGRLSHLHTSYDFKSVEEFSFWVTLAYHASESQLSRLLDLLNLTVTGVEVVGFQAYLDLTASEAKRKLFIQRVSDNENICICEKPPQYGDGQAVLYIDEDDFFDIVSDALAGKVHARTSQTESLADL
jgi:hypothetical protein